MIEQSACMVGVLVALIAMFCAFRCISGRKIQAELLMRRHTYVPAPDLEKWSWRRRRAAPNKAGLVAS